jgi:signal transduction histidine kinase/ActR/RegA family two-component response regulator
MHESSLPVQVREQIVLSPDLRVVALGHALPKWLGVEYAACVGVTVTDLMLQLEAALGLGGLSSDIVSALDAARATLVVQTTGVFWGRPNASWPCDRVCVRVVLTPLSGDAGDLHGLVLAIEDVADRVGLAERCERLTRESDFVRAELASKSHVRLEEVEHANAELLREIADHMKTENTLRITQERLHHAQRLEAVGRLAGGVAHDFNNLLSVVLGYSLTLIAELPPESPLRADIEEIKRAGERAAELTRQLLAFGRQQVLEPRLLDLNEIVLRMDRMMRRILGEDIEIVTIPAPHLWKAKLDPGQIEQVIVNLVINARDAMPAGGRLTIETSNETFDQDYANAHVVGAASGPYIVLAVSDTGVGMSKEVQSRAFEPFFTTKERGKGTGLGLSTVFGIVKQSGGHIWLYSEPGKGTTFKLSFPRVTDETEFASEPAPARVSEVPKGNETILLVEDDVQLRALARMILLRLGYRVLEACDGVEALKLSRDFAGDIALLLTDVVMPHMNGRELAQRLSRLRPQTKVLYMSGYTDNAIVHNGILDKGIAFIQKPVTPDMLARRVRQVLDARNNSVPPSQG